MKRAQKPQPRLPAYARPLLELRRKGLVPAQSYPGCRTVPAEINVSLDSWEWRQHKDYVRVVVTPDMDPAELDFSFLAGLSTLLAWWPVKTPKERCDATIRAILRGNPLRLVLVSDELGLPARIQPITIIKSTDVGICLAEYFA